MNRKNCTLLPCPPRLQRSRPTSPGGAAFVLWAQQGTGRQATVLLEKTCSYHSQGWLLGWCNPSLNQQFDFRASGHVFSLSKAWCSNRLSSCNSGMGRGKCRGRCFCIFTPNLTQCAHHNRGSEILTSCWYLGVVAHPSLPTCRNFFSVTYWMVFSSTEERKYQGFLQESCSSALAVFVRFA